MAESTRKPGDGFPDVKKSRNASATGAHNAERLVPGATYTAQVQARQGDGTYSVTTEDPQQDVQGVRLAVPVLGGLYGLKIRCSLPQYTKVKIAYGTPSFIYAVIPENNTDWLNAQTRSILWGPAMDKEQGVTLDNFSDHAEDLLEGEVELNNMFGIALEFLTTLIRMKASDRAVVECHLINDMVRVISAQYRHISGLGEDLIFDHGRPTMERSWSMYRHEVLGIAKEKEPFAKMNGDEVDREDLDARRVLGLGRKRLHEFIGFAGDFIHSFVSDPAKTIVSLGSPSSAASGAGKSWLHRNSDGSVIIQSTADIRIERTCRIPVAFRYQHHEDPEITKGREYDALTKSFLELPKALTPADPLDIYQAAYHIRSYSRWLGRYHAFARMLQLDQEYHVPSEAGSPAPDWRNREADREDANGRATYQDDVTGDKVLYYDAYACFAIHRDGSIVVYDGYGGAVTMSNGNIQISATRHIDLEAAGDIRMVAGGSILMKARRNIELNAVLGGIVMAGYSWLKMICLQGTLWLRSNAVTDKEEPMPEAAETGMPLPEVAGKVHIAPGNPDNAHGAAILIEAAEGHAIYRSQMGAVLAVDGSPSDTNDDKFNLTVSTNGDLDLRGKRAADLRSSQQTRVAGGTNLLLSSLSLLSDANELLIGRNLDAPDLILRNKLLWCQRMYASDLAGGRITGPERGPRVPIPDPQREVPLKHHINHIDVFPKNIAPEPPEGATDTQKELMAAAAMLPSAPAMLPWKSSVDGPLWAFPPSEEYVWDNREKTEGGLPETLTQQHLRLDALTSPTDRWGGAGYKTWSLKTGISGRRIKSSGGFGANELLYRASDEGESLHAPSSTPPSGFADVQIEWKPIISPTLQVLKRAAEDA